MNHVYNLNFTDGNLSNKKDNFTALNEVEKCKICAGFSEQILCCLFIILRMFEWIITQRDAVEEVHDHVFCITYKKTKLCWVEK